MFLLIFILIIDSLVAEECYYDGDDFCVNQDDILSVDLLPGTFLLSSLYKNASGKSQDEIKVNGTYEAALKEMNYHR